MHALSDKPDPGWGYNTHTWEQCARQLLSEVAHRGVGDTTDRIVRLLAKSDGRRRLIEDAITLLQHAAK